MKTYNQFYQYYKSIISKINCDDYDYGKASALVFGMKIKGYESNRDAIIAVINQEIVLDISVYFTGNRKILEIYNSIKHLIDEPRNKAIHSFISELISWYANGEATGLNPKSIKRMMKIINSFSPHLLSGAKELVCYYQHGYCNYGAIAELKNHGFDLNAASNLSPYFLEYLRK